ncbi:cupin domain-containing protein [Halomicroarcula sp. GCM10025324]|uniref:cupin domain-containing protein n=1 Tax=Haloarcula TaxID=2237 RepID=UPI0023E791E1|nr:cupin domain-containing protein [Halomicroarcula sp. ZS-22-S1]
MNECSDESLSTEHNLHTHPPNELFYVLEGTMTLYVDGQSHQLTPGETGFVPANQPHGFRVTGDDPLHVLAIFVPAGMGDFFREVGTSVETREIPKYRGPTEEDLERMMAASPKYEMKRLGPLPPAM